MSNARPEQGGSSEGGYEAFSLSRDGVLTNALWRHNDYQLEAGRGPGRFLARVPAGVDLTLGLIGHDVLGIGFQSPFSANNGFSVGNYDSAAAGFRIYPELIFPDELPIIEEELQGILEDRISDQTVQSTFDREVAGAVRRHQREVLLQDGLVQRILGAVNAGNDGHPTFCPIHIDDVEHTTTLYLGMNNTVVYLQLVGAYLRDGDKAPRAEVKIDLGERRGTGEVNFDESRIDPDEALVLKGLVGDLVEVKRRFPAFDTKEVKFSIPTSSA